MTLEDDSAALRGPLPNGLIAGIVLVATTALVIFAMFHHPTGGSHQPGEVTGHVVRIGMLSGLVHGAMIAAMMPLTFGLAVFSARLGLQRSLVLAGLITFASGAVGHVGAALINGFIVLDLASRYVGAPADDMDVLRHILRFAWSANQALAGFGVIASSAGILFWSLDLLGRSGITKLTGLLGVAAAVVPAAGFVAGYVHLDVQGAFLIYAAQGVWTLAAGALLIAKRV